MSAAQRIPDTSELPDCPVCFGRLDLVYDRFNQRVYVCVDCHVGVTIPESAWDVVRQKREHRWPPKV